MARPDRKRTLWVVLFLFPIVCFVWFRTCAVDSSLNFRRYYSSPSAAPGQTRGMPAWSPVPPSSGLPEGGPGAIGGPASFRPRIPPTYKKPSEFNFTRYESRPEYIVTGTVTSEPEEEILPGTVVGVYATRSPATEAVEDPVTDTMTDEAGRYEIRFASPFLGWISARKPGFGHQDGALDARSPGLIIRNFVLKRVDSAIEGQVLETQGRSVPEALVTVSLSPVINPNGSTISAGFAKSDMAGRFQIRDLPSGRVYVSAFTPAHVRNTQELQLEPGKTKRVVIELVSTSTVAILVKDSQSKGISRAKAQTQAGYELANDRGVIRIAAPPGATRFECTVSAPGYIAKTLEMETNAARHEVTLEGAGACRGQVINERGAPVSDALVDVFPSEGEVLTDSAGMFSVPVPALPVKEIKVNRVGYLSERLLFLEEAAPSFVRIRLKRTEGGIYGRVVNDQGKPIKKFIMTTLDPQGGSGMISRMFEDEDGLFAISDVPPGNYQLTAASVGTAAKIANLKVEIRSGLYFGEVIVTLK
jgi:hypothetical protein